MRPFAKRHLKSPHSDCINTACDNLAMKLNGFSIGDLGLSEYNERYFGDMIIDRQTLENHLAVYGFLLRMAVKELTSPLEGLTFLDYGGGHGMLAMLAREAGFGTVYHNDIYPQSCVDAEAIAKAVGLAADGYIPGEIGDVRQTFDADGVKADVIADYDVIEHIYDVRAFMEQLRGIGSDHLVVVFGSGANGSNPLINRTLMAQHRYFEGHDREFKRGRKPTDTLKALREVRLEIITSTGANLTDPEKDQLVERTRGLLEPAIREAVEEYQSTGTMPPKPDHPTNTVDPYSGNWFEHIMEPGWLVDTLSANGLYAAIYPGFYGAGSGVKGTVKAVANTTIEALWPRGISLAPFYCLKGVAN